MTTNKLIDHQPALQPKITKCTIALDDGTVKQWTGKDAVALIDMLDTLLNLHQIRTGESLDIPKPTESFRLRGSGSVYRRTNLMTERRRLPEERQSITRKFEINNHKLYVTVGLFPDGTPGEIFVKIAKTGGTLSGLLDSWALTTSMALQYGVPVEVLIDKLSFTRFEPSGWSSVEGVGHATSVLDLSCDGSSYVF